MILQFKVTVIRLATIYNPFFLGRIKPIPPLRSHSLEQSNKDSGNCNPYASSPVVIPNVDNSDVVAGVSNGRSSPAAAVPPSGYVLAGQMNLGAINVPALNSANLSELNGFDHHPSSQTLLLFSVGI